MDNRDDYDDDDDVAGGDIRLRGHMRQVPDSTN